MTLKSRNHQAPQEAEALKRCGDESGKDAFIDTDNKFVNADSPHTIIPHVTDTGCPYCGALPVEKEYDFHSNTSPHKRIIKIYPCTCHAREAAAMEEKRSHEKRIAAAAIPPRYLKATLVPTGRSPYDEIIIPICRHYISGLQEGCGKRGLGLIGSVGTGKTYYMCAILLELINKGKQCLFINMPEFYHHLKSTFVPEGTREYAGLITRTREVQVLGIDEIGQRKLSEWAQEELYGIINHRYNYDLATLFTSSKAFSAHAWLISPDITDRLCEMCDAYEIEGLSLRKTHAHKGINSHGDK